MADWQRMTEAVTEMPYRDRGPDREWESESRLIITSPLLLSRGAVIITCPRADAGGCSARFVQSGRATVEG